MIDERIQDTYAQRLNCYANKNAFSDAYVKFFRWAADRLQDRDGIVCFVSNNSFVDQVAFDGMRKHLLKDFSQFYHVDLHGNVRKNPKLSGTTHNVFGIQVGVGITIAVRSASQKGNQSLHFHRVPESWRREEKTAFLRTSGTAKHVQWQLLEPNSQHTWLVPTHADEFSKFIQLVDKEAKATDYTSSNYLRVGVKTNRDDTAYDFVRETLAQRVGAFVEDYNAEVDRYKRASKIAECRRLCSV